MYDDYRDTGLFSPEVLKRIGALTGTRYAAQIKLQAFTQGAKERFGIFGFRLVETRYASVRLFLQIWDSRDGTPTGPQLVGPISSRTLAFSPDGRTLFTCGRNTASQAWPLASGPCSASISAACRATRPKSRVPWRRAAPGFP